MKLDVSERKTWQAYCCGEINVLSSVQFEEVHSGFLSERKEEGIWWLFFYAQSTITVVAGRCPRGRGAQELCGSRGGRPGLPVLTVSVDVKPHCKTQQEVCGSRGGRPGLPVPNSPYGLCGCKTTFAEE